MDFDKIFLKEATPTSIGGQAIMDGVMMRGPDRVAIAMRLPSDDIYLKTEKAAPKSKVMKIPIIRGVVAFVQSLTVGMSTLMKSADILERFTPEDEEEEPSDFEQKLIDKFGDRAVWNLMLGLSVVAAIALTVVGFIIFPTVAVNWLSGYITNSIVLNILEGVFRILLFVLYILAVSMMKDIKTLFMYHGAEHKTIHCYENGLELTPENARGFYTLHPRCGTSFLMFVMIISLLLFSLLGWPDLLMRVLSRLLLIPVIAGLSYELLRWAGRSDGKVVRALSVPGLLLQKLTTKEPTDEQLEIAIVSLKAVLVPAEAEDCDGVFDRNGNVVDDEPGDDEATDDEDDEVEDEDEDVDELARFINRHRYDKDPNSVSNTLKRGRETLTLVENGRREADDIFCYVMGFSHSDLITRSEEVLRDDDIAEYERLIERRLTGTPLQYITKVQEFMGLPFRVNESVLIPRLDTEILAEQAIGVISGKGWVEPQVLDLCSGSGVLGIVVAREFKGAEVTFADVSQDAMSVAMNNAQINNVFRRCMFLTGDMFDALPTEKGYDMIISNPPYIKTDVIGTLSTEVKDHEPLLALDGGTDGLDMYRKIAANAGGRLNDGGVLALEIGYDQAEDVARLLAESGDFSKAAVIKDLQGRDRVIMAERKGNR